MSETQAAGGNVQFTAGQGNPGGSFIFRLPDGTEYLRIDADGNAFIRSKLVESDRLVYLAFRDWLSGCKLALDPGEDGGEPATFTPHLEREEGKP